MHQRTDNLSWEETFMSIAMVTAMRSKDPVTQVGAVIVDSTNRVLSLGYNGAPNGFDDDDFPWGKGNEREEDNKYKFVVHAERNAILNFRGDVKMLDGATVYVTHSPCHECAKEIIQSGIKKVVYLQEYPDKFTHILFDKCGVEMIQMPEISFPEIKL